MAESGTSQSYSFSSEVDNMANSSVQVTQKLKNVATVKRKKQDTTDKQFIQKKEHESNVLLLSLRIVHSLLCSIYARSGCKMSNSTLGEKSVADRIAFRRCRKSSLLFNDDNRSLMTSGDSSCSLVNSTTISNSTSLSSLGCSSSVICRLCTLLRRIWAGYLPSEPASLPLNLEVVLRAMADVTNMISKFVSSGQSVGDQNTTLELLNTATTCSSQFPYSVLETTCTKIMRKKAKTSFSAIENIQFEHSVDDNMIPNELSNTEASSTIDDQGIMGVDIDVLREAKRKFSMLNISLSETVINLFSEELLSQYLASVPKDRNDLHHYLEAYSRSQAYLQNELDGVLNSLTSNDVSELTPKEYYEGLLSCSKMSFSQHNKLLSCGLSWFQLTDLKCNHDLSYNLCGKMRALLGLFLELRTSARYIGYRSFVASCVRCLCDVSMEITSSRAMHLTLDSNDDETVIVDAMLAASSALCLMSSFPNEPTSLTDLLVSTAVRLMVVVNLEREQNKIEGSTKVGLAFKEFERTILKLFELSSDDNTDLIGESFYCRCSLETRFKFLDLWVSIVSPETLISSSEDIVVCIKTMIEDTDFTTIEVLPNWSKEISYFLRLFHMK